MDKYHDTAVEAQVKQETLPLDLTMAYKSTYSKAFYLVFHNYLSSPTCHNHGRSGSSSQGVNKANAVDTTAIGNALDAVQHTLNIASIALGRNLGSSLPPQPQSAL